MKLYGADVCPFVHRVRLILAEKRVEHDYVAIDLANKPDWYHDVLPTGRVPLLEHNGFRLWESDIVCEYLDEAFLSPSFMPDDPGHRAEVRLAIQWIGSRFIPLFYKLLASQDPEAREGFKKEFKTVFEELAERIESGPGPYLGVELSLADFELYPWFERWCVLEHYRGFSRPSGFESVVQWERLMQERVSVKELRIPDEYFIAQYQAYADGSRTPK